MCETKEIRTFLAIEPPEPVRMEMNRIQDRLMKTVQGAIRWAGSSGIHLTLKFFGDIAETDIGRISTAVQETLAGLAPLQLEIRTLGVFPDARRPRVIWLGTRGETERLTSLQKALDRAFGKMGFPEEDRPFRAHWTLGRIKTPRGLTGLARALESGADLAAGTFSAEALILFKSDLTPRGAIYTKLAEFVLKG